MNGAPCHTLWEGCVWECLHVHGRLFDDKHSCTGISGSQLVSTVGVRNSLKIWKWQKKRKKTWKTILCPGIKACHIQANCWLYAMLLQPDVKNFLEAFTTFYLLNVHAKKFAVSYSRRAPILQPFQKNVPGIFQIVWFVSAVDTEKNFNGKVLLALFSLPRTPPKENNSCFYSK